MRQHALAARACPCAPWRTISVSSRYRPRFAAQTHAATRSKTRAFKEQMERGEAPKWRLAPGATSTKSDQHVDTTRLSVRLFRPVHNLTHNSDAGARVEGAMRRLAQRATQGEQRHRQNQATRHRRWRARRGYRRCDRRLGRWRPGRSRRRVDRRCGRCSWWRSDDAATTASGLLRAASRVLRPGPPRCSPAVDEPDVIASSNCSQELIQTEGQVAGNA